MVLNPSLVHPRRHLHLCMFLLYMPWPSDGQSCCIFHISPNKYTEQKGVVLPNSSKMPITAVATPAVLSAPADPLRFVANENVSPVATEHATPEPPPLPPPPRPGATATHKTRGGTPLWGGSTSPIGVYIYLIAFFNWCASLYILFLLAIAWPAKRAMSLQTR